MNRRPAFPLCVSKQKGLAIKSENFAKIYVIENKIVMSFRVAEQRKNAGGKNEGIFHYVIENKWCKNVRKQPFHYVDEKNSSYRQLSIMLMKKMELQVSGAGARSLDPRFKIQDSRIRGQILNPKS